MTYGQEFYIGVTIDNTWSTGGSLTAYNLLSSTGASQTYSNFPKSPLPGNDCVKYKSENWTDVLCGASLPAFCSWVIDYRYGNSRPHGVSYLSGTDKYCYWIEDVGDPSITACRNAFSVIPDLDAQRVVNRLIQDSNLNRDMYHIGYEDVGGGFVKTHFAVHQSWTYWDPNESTHLASSGTCIALLPPYGLWNHINCLYITASICSTVEKITVCGPPIVNNHTRIYNQTGEIKGDVVFYYCEHGYNISGGNINRTCGSDGLWSGDALHCAAIICGIPTMNPYTNIHNQSGVMVGDVVFYDCEPGYQRSGGNVNRTCGTDGLWSGDALECVVTYQTTEQSTSTTNQPPTVTEDDLCYCDCDLVTVLNITNIHERVKELERILAVDKEVLSSTIRAKTCAEDPRPSSTYIGASGVVIIIAVLSVICIFDFTNLLVYLKSKK